MDGALGWPLACSQPGQVSPLPSRLARYEAPRPTLPVEEVPGCWTRSPARSLPVHWHPRATTQRRSIHGSHTVTVANAAGVHGSLTRLGPGAFSSFARPPRSTGPRR